MWNREILPYLRGLRPLTGRGLYTEQKTGGTTFNLLSVPAAAPPRPAAAEAAYDSYFKLTLSNASGGSACTVTVADGATGGNSFAVVNGCSSYVLAPHVENVTGDRLFYLKYTPAVYGSTGAVVSSATMAIGSTVASGGGLTLPRGDGACYVQLGRVLWSGGSPRAVQDFTAGVADVRWYVSCY